MTYEQGTQISCLGHFTPPQLHHVGGNITTNLESVILHIEVLGSMCGSSVYQSDVSRVLLFRPRQPESADSETLFYMIIFSQQLAASSVGHPSQPIPLHSYNSIIFKEIHGLNP